MCAKKTYCDARKKKDKRNQKSIKVFFPIWGKKRGEGRKIANNKGKGGRKKRKKMLPLIQASFSRGKSHK